MKGATITYCSCPRPGLSINPRMQGSCVKCTRMLNPEWVSSDANMERLFGRLAEAMPPGEADSDDFWAFRAQLEAREKAGRDRFGFEYLAKDNPREATEEACDLALYGFLDSLRAIRDNGSDEDIDLVLEAAYYAFKAHAKMRHLRARRHGAP